MNHAKIRRFGVTYRWLLLLTCVCLSSRLLAISPFLEDWDSVDFALALDDYNIKRYQPHFPGYPVYIFLSWLCQRFVHEPATAVVLPGAWLGALTVIPVYGLAQRLFDRRVAALSALLFTVNPACWLQAEKAFSDASGLFVLTAAVYAGWRASAPDARSYHLFLSGFLLGLGLGVRLSYMPFLLSWAGLLMYLYRQPGSGAVPLSDGCYGLVMGVCLWLAPQLALTGGLDLLDDGLAFTSQHFSQWGGTLVSSATPEYQQVCDRLTMLVWGLLAYSLGFWWPDTSSVRIVPSAIMLIAFAFGCRQIRWGKRTGFLLLYTLPYGLWVFFGQHAEQPRHLLPLIPVLLVLLAVGLDRLLHASARLGWIACVLLFLVLGAMSTRLIVVHVLIPPPRLQVVHYVAAQYRREATRLYAWGTRRLFDFYAPTFDVRQRPDMAAAQRDLDADPPPAVLLATSDVRGVSTSPHMRPVRRFERDRYVHNPHHRVGLYRWYPPGGRGAR
jgi:hypothetical protein